MFSRVTTIVLALTLVATGIWGYREHKEKQALLLKAENQYQRAFHDLSDHMNLLQDELGKSLAVNSRLQRASALTEVWRLAAEARNDVGELPLSLMPFNSTMNFLTDVGNFSYRVAIHEDNTKGGTKQAQALSDQEWQNLQQLYERSKRLENQLSQLQSAVIAKNLRWMDAELALTQTDKKTDNIIVDGFRAIEKGVNSQKTLNFGPTGNDLKTRNRPNEAKLMGNPIDATAAAKRAKDFLGLPDTKNIIVQQNGKGAPFASYTITIKQDHKDRNAYMTMAVKGGNITSYMDNRTVQKEAIDLYQGAEYARKYLAAHQIDARELVNIDTYDHVGVYEFVPLVNGVRIYPDKLAVKVALDNGEVVGLNLQDYVFNHKPRTIAKATVSEADARKFVSPKVQIQEVRLAQILNPLRQEELAYEFIGTMDRDTYKVYISAVDGDEIGVEKLR